MADVVEAYAFKASVLADAAPAPAEVVRLYRCSDAGGEDEAVVLPVLTRRDADLMVNSHIYGTSAAEAPVLHFRVTKDDGPAAAYLAGLNTSGPWPNPPQTESDQLAHD